MTERCKRMRGKARSAVFARCCHNIRACLKNRKRRIFAPKRSSSASKSLVKLRFDCVFSLKLIILGQMSVISSIFKQALIPDRQQNLSIL